MSINKVVIVLLLLTSTAVAGKGLATLKSSLVTVALTASLATASVADDVLWQRVNSKSPAVHRATFLLDIGLASHHREMPIVMVGEDSQGRHLFIATRVYLLDLPLANGRLILDEANSIDLYAYDGLVDSDFVIDEIKSFVRPDNQLGRSYDFSVLAIEGLKALDNYPSARTAEFPALMTPLELVVYEPGGNGWRAYHRRCLARRHVGLWLAASDCVVPLMDNEFVDIGTPVSSTDKVVGLQVEPNDAEFPVMVTIPKDLQIFLDIELSVNPSEQLSTMWGKIKTGRH